MLGFVSAIFVDDTLLTGESEEECAQRALCLRSGVWDLLFTL